MSSPWKRLKSVGGYGHRVAIMRRNDSPNLYLRWGRDQWLSLGHDDMGAAMFAARAQAAALLSERGAVAGGVVVERLPAAIKVARAVAAPGFVYIIEAVGMSRVKIGFTADLVKRLRTLATASPTELRVLHVWECGSKFERRLHRALANHRIHGEWFAASVTEDAVAFMDEWLT